MRTSYPRILSVGTANPPTRYTQKEILDRYRVDNPMVRNIFEASHIEGRYLYLPPVDETGAPKESQSELLKKHRSGALEMASEAIAKCLKDIDAKPEDVDMLCCITSTGLMLPGLTAMFIKHLGFRINCHRMDLVGMGCNAGLNGLNPASSWAAESPCHQTDPSVVVVVAVVAGAVASLETGWGMPACPYLAAVPAVAAWGVLGTL